MNSCVFLYSVLVIYCALCSATDIFRDDARMLRKVRDDCVKDKAPEASKCAFERLHWIYPNGTLNMSNCTTNFKKAAEKCLEQKEKVQTNGKFNITLLHYCAAVTVGNETANLLKDCEKEFGKMPNKLDSKIIMKDNKLACLINCAVVKYNAIDEQGNFKMNEIVSKEVSGYDIPGMVEKCVKANQQTDACQRGALRFFCLNEAVEQADRIKHQKS